MNPPIVRTLRVACPPEHAFVAFMSGDDQGGQTIMHLRQNARIGRGKTKGIGNPAR